MIRNARPAGVSIPRSRVPVLAREPGIPSIVFPRTARPVRVGQTCGAWEWQRTGGCRRPGSCANGAAGRPCHPCSSGDPGPAM